MSAIQLTGHGKKTLQDLVAARREPLKPICSACMEREATTPSGLCSICNYERLAKQKAEQFKELEAKREYDAQRMSLHRSMKRTSKGRLTLCLELMDEMNNNDLKQLQKLLTERIKQNEQKSTRRIQRKRQGSN